MFFEVISIHSSEGGGAQQMTLQWRRERKGMKGQLIISTIRPEEWETLSVLSLQFALSTYSGC